MSVSYALPSQRQNIRRSLRQTLPFWLFIAPWLIGFLVFTAGPMLASLVLSFTDYNALSSPVFSGLSNYRRMAADPLVLKSIGNTFTYAIFAAPLKLTLALTLAMILNQNLRFLGAFRTAYYLPSIIPTVTLSLTWALMFNYQDGVLNYFLGFLHIERVAWLTSENGARVGILIISLWGAGTSMLVLLAGLQGIPTALYEASAIDGAGAWHKFRYITLPMLTPSILFLAIMSTISNLQIFSEAYVITEGGPQNATLYYVLYLFRHAFEWMDMGYGCALAWVLFVVIMTCSALIFGSSSRWVSYETT